MVYGACFKIIREDGRCLRCGKGGPSQVNWNQVWKMSAGCSVRDLCLSLCVLEIFHNEVLLLNCMAQTWKTEVNSLHKKQIFKEIPRCAWSFNSRLFSIRYLTWLLLTVFIREPLWIHPKSLFHKQSLQASPKLQERVQLQCLCAFPLSRLHCGGSQQRSWLSPTFSLVPFPHVILHFCAQTETTNRKAVITATFVTYISFGKHFNWLGKNTKITLFIDPHPDGFCCWEPGTISITYLKRGQYLRPRSLHTSFLWQSQLY